MSRFGREWDEGTRIAYFGCETLGPEGRWTIEMRTVKSGGDFYTVVYDPFADRLMWFDADRKETDFEARMVFRSLVEIALCDTCSVRNAHVSWYGDDNPAGRTGSSRKESSGTR